MTATSGFHLLALFLGAHLVLIGAMLVCYFVGAGRYLRRHRGREARRP